MGKGEGIDGWRKQCCCAAYVNHAVVRGKMTPRQTGQGLACRGRGATWRGSREGCEAGLSRGYCERQWRAGGEAAILRCYMGRGCDRLSNGETHHEPTTSGQRLSI